MPHSDRVDFLVLAPLDLEIKALRRVFPEYQRKHDPDGLPYDECSIRGRDGQLKIRIVKLPKAGVLRAGVFATKLLARWKPRYLVSFGITGGFIDSDPDGVQFKDVLVADYVLYYEPAKEQNQERQPRTDPFSISPEFPVQASRYDPTQFGTVLEGRKIHVGYLASGEKLIDGSNSVTREAIKKTVSGKAYGFEQEAAGVGAACRWTQTFPEPGFLVVKGISDDGVTKDATNPFRPPAAQNAAVVLRRLLEDTVLQVAYESGVPKALAGLLKIAERMKEELDPYLYPEELLNLQALTRVLHSIDELPTVFYHWRARHNHVHWVDFYHLLLIKRLCKLGMKAHILLTEVSGQTTETGKAKTKAVIDSVLDSDEPEVTWYSELDEFRESYEPFAAKVRFDAAAKQAVISAEELASVKTGNLVDADWLQFIAWKIGGARRCFLLTWHKHAAIARELSKLLFLNVVSILMPDLRIGQALGKFDQPSVSLVIDPPNYESIIGWLKELPEPEYVHDLANHLTLGKPTTGDLSEGAKALLEGAPDLQSLLVRENSDFAQSSRSLLNEMSVWNEQFFSSWHRGG